MNNRDIIRIIGYHTTTINNARFIRRPSDFRPSVSKKDWLGKGVYFWDEIINARWWAKARKFFNVRYIFRCLLECDGIYFFDLDKTEECTLYREFVDNIDRYVVKMSNELKDRYIDYDFKSVEEIRCFYLDAFKEINNIKLIRRSFDVEGDNTPDDGIIMRRRQLCVTDKFQSDVIKTMEMYHEQ